MQDAVQPLAAVIVTLYVPAKLTKIQLVDAPLLHIYVDAPGEAHICAD